MSGKLTLMVIIRGLLMLKDKNMTRENMRFIDKCRLFKRIIRSLKWLMH